MAFLPHRKIVAAVSTGLLLALFAGHFGPETAAGADPASAAPDAHQHPDAGAKTAAEVGLDEQLGARIPLEPTFRNEAGEPVRLADLVSGPTVIAPVYYHCPNVCSFLQGGLARALPDVGLTPGEDFQVISLSFDETETPELARRQEAIYMDAMGGAFPEGAWHFLTGKRKNILQVTDAAGYRFKRQGEDFLHPVAIFVVSADGKIVRYLHGTHFLPKDLTLALVEASSGQVGTTIRKVAQFCFSYDPESQSYVFNVFRVSATIILLTAGAFLAFLIFWGRKKPKPSRKP